MVVVNIDNKTSSPQPWAIVPATSRQAQYKTTVDQHEIDHASFTTATISPAQRSTHGLAFPSSHQSAPGNDIYAITQAAQLQGSVYYPSTIHNSSPTGLGSSQMYVCRAIQIWDVLILAVWQLLFSLFPGINSAIPITRQ